MPHMSHTSPHLTQHTQTITQPHTHIYTHKATYTYNHTATYVIHSMSLTHTHRNTDTCHMAHVEYSLQGLVFFFPTDF